MTGDQDYGNSYAPHLWSEPMRRRPESRQHMSFVDHLIGLADEEGMRAAFEGAAIDECPYPDHSLAARAWRGGHDAISRHSADEAAEYLRTGSA